ncbi:MAG TPA: hypothetical protein VIH99_07505 [Bdellovibrionota bacterium]|jgi:hypothetical protein
MKPVTPILLIAALSVAAAPEAQAGGGYYTYPTLYNYLANEPVFVPLPKRRDYRKYPASSRYPASTITSSKSSSKSSSSQKKPAAAPVPPVPVAKKNSVAPAAPVPPVPVAKKDPVAPAAPVPPASPAVQPKKVEPASPAGGMCLADEQRNKTTAEFENGIAEIRNEANAINQNAVQAVAHVKGLYEKIKCNETFGDDLRAKIDEKQSDGKSIIPKIQELGAKSKEAALEMAAALEGAKNKYHALDFCNVNACEGAFSALGGVFSPVSAQAQVSLAALAKIRKDYIAPSKAMLDDPSQRTQLEWVVDPGSFPGCNSAQRELKAALANWEVIQKKFKVIEQKIQQQEAASTKLAAASHQAASCSMASNR